MPEIDDKEAAMTLYKIITNPEMHVAASECERIFNCQLWLKEIINRGDDDA